MNDTTAITACGSPLTNPERYPSALYRGARVYFCLRACRRVFEADPDRFMAGQISHPERENPDEDGPSGGPA